MRMRSPPLANSFWIEPGRLLAGDYPGEADRARSAARLGELIGAGISYFIDLTEPGELAPYDHCLPTMRADDGRYIIYVRKAIRDQGLPRSPQAMAEIIDYVERAIEVGHQVYVHCRAGIGRTSTVVGCWLRRGGYSGPDAIERLNQLSKVNAQTAEQQRYVLEWLEPAEPAQSGLDMDAARILRDRYLGSMLGLACGDAMGASLQFRKPGQFAPLADLIGGGHWQLPRGAWTDDTAMSLCLAESLLEMDGFDAADQSQRYRRWQRDGHLSSTGQCIGITATVASALRHGAGVHPGTADADPQALTRTGVVAMFAVSTPDRALAWAAAAAAVTDRSPALQAACRSYACLLLAALRGASRDRILEDAQDLMRFHGGAGPLAALDLVLETLLKTLRFRDGLLRIVNLGGDSDMHGALYGQLAGAFYGVQGIPKPWKRALLRLELLQDVADRLLVAGLAPRE
ncbi:MAG: ADP-ribosylglycohydrolase family protein [Steroidobacteraceae bacterium]|jgi:ADP-ribosyl-[dinitrogen reductase] hydrolase